MHLSIKPIPLAAGWKLRCMWMNQGWAGGRGGIDVEKVYAVPTRDEGVWMRLVMLKMNRRDQI